MECMCVGQISGACEELGDEVNMFVRPTRQNSAEELWM